MGMVRNTIIGLRKAFNIAITKATIMAVVKPSMLTPGIKYWAITIAKLDTNILKKNIFYILLNMNCKNNQLSVI